MNNHQNSMHFESQQDFLEDNICYILVLLVFSHDGKLETVRLSNSGTGHIQLTMGEHVRAQPNSNILQCLT